MPILSQQDILRLDIPINDAILMQIRQSQENLDDIKPRDVLTQSSVSLDQAKQLSSWAILYHKDEELLSFKRKLHLNKERMGGFFHDVSLIHYDVFLLIFDDDVLVDYLHCVEFAVFLEPA